MSGDGADAADGDVVVVEVVRWPELKSNGSVTAVDTKNDAAFADSGVVMGLVVTAVVVDVGQHAGVENAHREEAGATRFSRRGGDHDVPGVFVLHDVRGTPGDDVAGANDCDLVNGMPARSVVGQRAEVVAILEGAGPDMVWLFGDEAVVGGRDLLEDIADKFGAVTVVGACGGDHLIEGLI